jgi:hypothetical protein
MIMLILMSAALAAAVPAVSATPPVDSRAQQMSQADSHEQMKCCECCKDMAGNKDRHVEHERHQPR